MLFNSWEFLFFCVLVMPVYFGIRHGAQNWLLLVASYVFYGWWDWRFLGLIFVTTVFDYFIAGAMESATQDRRRKLLLLSLALNLTILGFFKYFNFFVGSAAVALRAFGVEVHPATLTIILPVGISFYTFQEMSYVVDVYRGQLKPCRNFRDWALFVCFFPQLVAGPIERAAQLLPQITNPRPAPNLQRFASGGVLILIGLVRKVAIADVVAADVDQVFANAQNFGSLALLRAVVLFALQIYCDFAGYSDIARGTSRILGVELMENFAHPYFATSITDFWRRWHISLSTWLRDYLYIPLGGNRGSRLKTHRNLMLTMVLGGLWHGASWTFVVWGGLHGVALAANKAWNGLRGASPGRSRGISVLVKAAAWAGTMALVCVAWVFFRAPDFATAFNVLRGIVSFSGPLSVSLLMKPALMIALLLLIDVPQAWLRDHAALLRWPLPLRGFAYAGFVMLMIYLSTGENVPFIYFQF